MTKILLTCVGSTFMSWQTKVFLSSEFVDLNDVVLLTTHKALDIEGVEQHEYCVDWGDYLPSVQWELVNRYWHDYGNSGDFWLMDSDTLVLDELPDMSMYPDDVLIGADTSGYTGGKYYSQFYELKGMFPMVDDDRACGACYWIRNPHVDLSMGERTKALYEAMVASHTKAQTWTASMLVPYEYYRTQVDERLAFAWATDTEFNGRKFYHNAGITSADAGFYKGAYTSLYPPERDLIDYGRNLSDWYAVQVKKALYGK